MLDPLSALMHRNAGWHGPAMLMYHAVEPGAGSPRWPWAVSLQRFRTQLDLLSAEGWRTPTLQELIAAPEHWASRTVVITFDDGYADNLFAVEELQQRGMRATWFVVSGSIGREPSWPATGRPAGRLLNAAELREMQSAGMEIGSHTVSHVRLTEISEAHRRSELVDSRTEIEGALGNAISSFAYPYGVWDSDCVKAVEQAGYRGACTTRTGWALRDGNPYLLRRLTVFNTDTASSIARKLYLGDNDASWARAWSHFGSRARSRFARKSA
ncbi:polysaccharide deacetylase family protein [Aromatoleum bremense]|uniref:Polysaccharide deacetylase family protein n=1 Tax=Aromatoleum bremense TaxID=76115 RepID=A0ABX1NX11_9RHOO|nr:polysaccharide deacetylase family protein [Aromatoleum bremense]NMG16545.1 polysaccharide deacetylase family protein [Aromatoleum bremense]QTQ32806.1 putative polysaccharide deacetylase [Aromatoleum bremense]